MAISIRLLRLTCFSSWGFQCISRRNKWLAPTRFNPTPPAPKDSSITCAPPSRRLKSSTISERILTLTFPMIRKLYLFVMSRNDKFRLKYGLTKHYIRKTLKLPLTINFCYFKTNIFHMLLNNFKHRSPLADDDRLLKVF